MKFNISKRSIGLIILALFSGIFLGWLFFHSSESEIVEHNHNENAATETIYTCSMHPQIKSDKPGLCPICGMELVPMNSPKLNENDVNPNEIYMSEAALALASVETTVVKKGIPEKQVHLLGKIKADETKISTLTARFGGRIEKLFVNYTGQKVNEGQKMAKIYSPELITAQKELLEAIKYKESNPTFYYSARTKLKLWDLNDEQIAVIEKEGEPQLYFDVLAPMNGTVSKRQVALGDYIKEGSALFEIVDLSRIWVMFDAYESDLPWIKIGDKVDFTVQSVPGKSYSGKLTYIDPFIDPKTRVAQVRVEMSNLDMVLKPEMFASGILTSNVAGNTNEILIPKSAILWTGKRAVVYIKNQKNNGSYFHYREVVLGPEAGNFYVVKEGLNVGEIIAINGVFRIDAAAQLAGKQSMMNPESEIDTKKQNPENMDMKNNSMEENMDMKANVENTSFKVSGNCEMCKARIEKVVNQLEGVNSATWDIETKMLNVSYNKDKIKLSAIHKVIAKVGHDTEKESATMEAYNTLPPCCQYSR